MNNICQFHKFGYCKLKDKCEKEHVNRECPEGSHCKGIQTCALRNPKMCKIIVMEGICHFREKCSYNHKRKDNWKSDYNNDLHDNVKKLKEEVGSLKNTIQSLIKTREECDQLKNHVEDITEEIKLLTKSYNEIKTMIDYLENYPVEESDIAEVNVSNEKQNTVNKNKCSEFGFVGNKQVSIKKHINTIHAPINMETKTLEENTMLQDIDDYYQI